MTEMEKLMKLTKPSFVLLLGSILTGNTLFAGTVTILGAGSGGAPIMVTSAGTNIDLGTRVRIGSFNDLTLLNSAISAFSAGTANFTTTLSSLNSNFADIGTNVTNYGVSSQTGTGVSSSQFVFQGSTTSLTVNGLAGQTWNIFNGSVTSVNYSSAMGASKNLYFWVAFNNEIGIVRNADGTGTSSWITPTSDLSGVTMNLSGINSQAEVLLGTYTDYATGNDLIRLAPAIPEPSTGALMMIGAAGLVALRRLRKV